MTHLSVSSLNFNDWDKELTSIDADFPKLFEQMSKASDDASLPKIEVLWRLAKVGYYVTFNLVGQRELDQLGKAIDFAEKALVLDEMHFEAHLWCAFASGKIAQLMDNFSSKLKPFEMFLKHLDKLIQLQANHSMVLYLEGRLYLSIFVLTTEQKAILHKANLKVPQCSGQSAEEKLLKSIELSPRFLDAQTALSLLYFHLKKFSNARVIIAKALSLPKVTKWDNVLSDFMKQLVFQMDKVESITDAYKNAVDKRPMAKRIMSDKVRNLTTVQLAGLLSQGATAKATQPKEESAKNKSK